MLKAVRVGYGDLRGGCARDYAIKRGIIKLRGNEEGSAHLIEMGHEIADGRDKGVGIHHFHGINAAGVPIDEIVSGERQLPVARLPAGGAVGVAGKNPAFIKQRALTASKKAAHASHGVGYIRRGGVVGIITRSGRRALVGGIEHEDMRGVDVRAVVPNVGDDDASEGTGKIDSDTPRGIIGRVEAHADGIGGRLAAGRVGRFAGGHGHDLLAHDHEAVIEDAHHHDEEDGQDERELDESLALAPPAPGLELLKIREGLHGSFA